MATILLVVKSKICSQTDHWVWKNKTKSIWCVQAPHYFLFRKELKAQWEKVIFCSILSLCFYVVNRKSIQINIRFWSLHLLFAQNKGKTLRQKGPSLAKFKIWVPLYKMIYTIDPAQCLINSLVINAIEKRQSMQWTPG